MRNYINLVLFRKTGATLSSYVFYFNVLKLQSPTNIMWENKIRRPRIN